jgi:hypothetical protein
MTKTFTVSGVERTAQSQGDRLMDEARDSGNGQDMAEATPVPYDSQH